MRKKQNITILAGAMGTELQRRGYPTKLPLWSGTANLEAPELVEQIHKDYVEAGADWITTNTFRTNIRPWKLVKREKDAAISTKKAIEIALSVKKKYPHIKIGGSISTVEDCYEPESVPSDEELEQEHSAQIALFASTGIDFFLLETLNTIREATILLKYAKKTGLPSYVSIVTNPEGDVLSGENIEDFVIKMQSIGADGLLINCRPPHIATHAAKKLSKIYEGVKGIFANGEGQAGDELGWIFDNKDTKESYLAYAQKWVNMGFTIIGGCCGTNPEYIALLTKTLKN